MTEELTKKEPQDDTPLPQEAEAASEPVRNKYADKMDRPKKRMPKGVRRAITIVLLTAVIGGAVYLVKRANKPAQTDDQTSIGYTSRGMLETFIEGSGQTSAKNRAELGKELKGTVTEVLVKEGDRVTQGQTLYIVNPEDTRKDLDTARSELQDAQRSLDEAAAGVRTAQKNVTGLSVTAPFAGKLIPPEGDAAGKTYHVGDDIGSGVLLGTIVDDSTMRLPLYYSYAYIDQIKTGAAATVSIPSNMSTVSGRVESIDRIEKISDDGTKLFRVIVTMNNPGALKKGMTATASIATAGGTVMPAETGVMEYSREQTITTEQSGEITMIANMEYYRFSSGATLLRMKNDDLTTAIESAQRSVQSAQKALADKQTRIAELEKLIVDSTVLAPMDGIVTQMSAQVGDKLEGSAASCIVVDLTSIVVKADITELDIDKVQAGQTVTITNDMSETQDTYMGTVESVSMQATTANGSGGGNNGNSTPTFPIVITLEDPAGTLPPDRTVSFRISTAMREDCIMVPSSAVVYTENGAAIWARPAEGETFDNVLPTPEGSKVPEGFVLVSIETGIFDDTNTEIISGVDENIEVYLAGPKDPFADEEMMGGMSVAVG